MKRAELLGAMALAALLLSGCSSGGARAEATDPPDPTDPPTTPAPWPVGFQEDVCSAIVQLDGAGDDLIELSAAAEELDVERVSLMAYAASGWFAGIKATLIDTPSWGPGDLLVDRLREIADQGLTATELIDEGATDLDVDKLERGSSMLARVGLLAESATAALSGLQRNRGFTC